jgi:catechol 2,3-dioxygenase-like lactoylglutathione lyase family enzyme
VAAVRYIVDNVESAISFYTGLLGFKVKEKWGEAFAILSSGDLDLWLSGPGTSARRPMQDGVEPLPGGWNRIVIQPANFEACVTTLRDNGNLRSEPIKGPGGHQALAADPSGNLIEIFEGSP